MDLTLPLSFPQTESRAIVGGVMSKLSNLRGRTCQAAFPRRVQNFAAPFAPDLSFLEAVARVNQTSVA